MKVALAPPTATTLGRRPRVVVALMGWGIGLAYTPWPGSVVADHGAMGL